MCLRRKIFYLLSFKKWLLLTKYKIRINFKTGKVGNAIQINQVYAQIPKFQEIAKRNDGKIATDSFNRMIVKNPEFYEAKDDVSFKSDKMVRTEQIEAMLSKTLTEGGNYYTQNDIDNT
jgi:hypothetical protein